MLRKFWAEQPDHWSVTARHPPLLLRRQCNAAARIAAAIALKRVLGILFSLDTRDAGKGTARLIEPSASQGTSYCTVAAAKVRQGSAVSVPEHVAEYRLSPYSRYRCFHPLLSACRYVELLSSMIQYRLIIVHRCLCRTFGREPGDMTGGRADGARY